MHILTQHVQGHNDYSITPFFVASYSGHFEIVQWLLSHRANPNHRYKTESWTSLHAAADVEQVVISRLLLQYNADIYAHDNKGRTPLQVAVQYAHVNVARLLLEHSADVNARDNSRNTPLLGAVKRRRLGVARLLIEHGAIIDAEDNNGRTALSEGFYEDPDRPLLGWVRQ